MAAKMFLGLIFIFSTTNLVAALCPSMCICDFDQQNRKRVLCQNGDVSIPGSFNIQDLDQDTVVLIVSGPLEKPNTFSNLNDTIFLDKIFTEIHLTNSRSEPIAARLFQNVASTLQLLNLTHNKIKTLTENNFRDLSRLTHLYLADNNIQDIPSVMGSGSTNLQVLDLSNNLIGGGLSENLFVHFLNLKVLKLANIGLTSLSTVVQTLRNNGELEELDLSKNQFSAVAQNQFVSLSKLKRLSLSGNSLLQFIGNGAFSGTNLDHLDLSGLLESLLKAGIFDGAKIRSLDLSEMNLSNFNQEMFATVAAELTGLHINGNRNLNVRRGMFSSFKALKQLTMARVGLTTLSEDLFQLAGSSLDTLDLSKNEIAHLDEAFFIPLINLRHLNLAGNRLFSVPGFLKKFPTIQTLDLSNNRLTSFPESIIYTLASVSSDLKSLRLNDNPWKCNCGLVSLGRWVTDQGISGFQKVCVGNDNSTCPVCEEPSELKGTPINALPQSVRLLENCAPEEKSNFAVEDVKSATSVIGAALLFALLLHQVPAFNVEEL